MNYFPINYKLCVREMYSTSIVAIVYGSLEFIPHFPQIAYILLLSISAILFGGRYWLSIRKEYINMMNSYMLKTHELQHILNKSISILIITFTGAISISDFLGTSMYKMSTPMDLYNNLVKFIFAVIFVAFILNVSYFVSNLEFNEFIYDRNRYIFQRGISNTFQKTPVIIRYNQINKLIKNSTAIFYE